MSQNVFLDKNLNAKLVDYASSLLNGSPFLIVVIASHQYPRLALFIKGNLFAFSSILYKFIIKVALYYILSKADIFA